MKQLRSRKHRYSLFPVRGLLVFYDILVFATVMAFALILFPRAGITPLEVLWHFLLAMPVVITARFFLRVYSQIWRYGGISSYVKLMLADTISLFIYFFVQKFVPVFFHLEFVVVTFIVLTNTLVCLAIRMVYRYTYTNLNRRSKFGRIVVKLVNTFGRCGWTISDNEKIEKVRIAIVGAGGVGTALGKELLDNPNSTYEPVCFVDNDKEKLGREVFGKEVLFDDDTTPEILKGYKVQEVVLALPPEVTSDTRKGIYNRYKQAGFKIKSYDYPTMQSTKSGKRIIRDFDIEDVLFRQEQNIMTDETVKYYKDKTVLITGGGGSIGSEIARQLAKMDVKRLVLLDIYENGVYDVQQELKMTYGNDLDLRVEITSITDKVGLERVFKEHKPNIVIMAAAHKHVPLMEHNIIEAVQNNVFGTLNTVLLSEKYKADRVHLVSTDKAVNPTNVMGATKRMCEMIVFSRSELKQHTTFSATRFGNVLGSAGSVIPLFKRQIANGGPVTLTDKNIIRYFMTIPEASQLVLHSATIAKNGQLMVLDMGQPIKIHDLAVSMIKLSGLEPDKDIKILETGLRPGEKLYEELLMKSETLQKTNNKKIFIEQDHPVSIEELNDKLDELVEAMKTDSEDKTKVALKHSVPTFMDLEETGGGQR